MFFCFHKNTLVRNEKSSQSVFWYPQVMESLHWQPYYSECIKEFNLVLWISRFECTWILCFLKAEITVIFHHNIVTWRCGISLYLHGSILMRFVCNVILILVSSLNYCYFLHFPRINIFPHATCWWVFKLKSIIWA